VQIGVTLMGTLAGVLGGYLAKLFIEPLIASSGSADGSTRRWAPP
jgi:hypothetical protein